MAPKLTLLYCLLILSIASSECKNSNECVTHGELDKMLEASRYKTLTSVEKMIKASHDKTMESVNHLLQTRKVSRQSSEGVAFSTSLTGDMVHVGLRQTIKYNTVQLNEGNGYNKFTGSFIAPTDGVYLFSYILGHVGVGQTWLELMHNGHKINAGVTDGFVSHEDDQGGNVAIIRLAAGDSVWVESWHQNDAALQGDFGFTTFSGVKIY